LCRPDHVSVASFESNVPPFVVAVAVMWSVPDTAALMAFRSATSFGIGVIASEQSMLLQKLASKVEARQAFSLAADAVVVPIDVAAGDRGSFGGNLPGDCQSLCRAREVIKTGGEAYVGVRVLVLELARDRVVPDWSRSSRSP